MNKQKNNQVKRGKPVDIITDDLIPYGSPLNIHWFLI